MDLLEVKQVLYYPILSNSNSEEENVQEFSRQQKNVDYTNLKKPQKLIIPIFSSKEILSAYPYTEPKVKVLNYDVIIWQSEWYKAEDRQNNGSSVDTRINTDCLYHRYGKKVTSKNWKKSN